MDKKEVMKRYIDKYIIKLTSPNTTKEVEKSLRTKFENENNLKSNLRFSASDVAEEIAKHIMNSRSLSKGEFVSELQKVPWVRTSIPEEKMKLIYDTNVSEESLFFKVEDLPKLNQEEYLKRIEEEYGKRAMKKHEEEIKRTEEEIKKVMDEYKKKREELEKFQSELNKLPPDFQIQDLENQVVKVDLNKSELESTVWWSKLDLPANPFETNMGLTGFASDEYENVVVKTPLLKKYKSELSQNPEAFAGKTIMLIGDFGSGKTTIFQYLSYFSMSYDILPLNLILTPSDSVSNLNSQLLEELIAELSENFKRIKKFDPRSDRPNGIAMRYCADLLNELQSDIQHGFLVFIDGLHKGDAYVQQSLDFLKQIQNVLEYFSNHSIKIGFFISGSPLWDNELSKKPSLSGSIYRKDTIPILTEDYAIEAIERRINLYHTNEPQGLTVDRKSLQRAFVILGDRLRKVVTFRDFLDHIRERLEINEFEEVGISVKIHIETTDAVKASLKGTSIGAKYDSILREILPSIQVRLAFKRIMPVILREGISEKDQDFRNYLGVLRLLKKYDLIVQRKSEDGYRFKWYFSDEFASSIVEVSKKLKISPTKVVISMFEEETLARVEETSTIYASSIKEINNMIALWKDSNPDVAKHLESCKEEIRVININIKDISQINPRNLREAVISIIKAINLVLHNQVSDENDFESFSNSWAVPENISEIGEFANSEISVPFESSAILGMLHNHNKYIFQLLILLSDLMRGESISKLAGRDISLSEFQSIHVLRLKFLNQSYEEVIDGVCTHLESNIREVGYPCMRAVWSQKAFDSLPEDIQRNVLNLSNRGHPRTKRDLDSNFFFSVSRSEYSKILFKREVFKALFSDILVSNDDQTKFQNLMRLSFSLDDRRAHRERKEYFREHATEIGDILKGLPWMLEKFHKMEQNFLVECEVILKNENDKLVSQFKPSLKDSVHPVDIILSKDDLRNITMKILEPLAVRDRPLTMLGGLLQESGQEPEIYLSVLRTLISQGYIQWHKNRTFPILISITANGTEWLSKH